MRLLSGVSEAESLAPAWDRLASLPTQQWIWTRAAAESFRGRLQVVVVGPDEAPRALCPLLRRRVPLSPLEVPGVRMLGEPTDALYRDESAVEELADALADLRRPLHLRRVFADSPLLGALERRGRTFRADAGGCPYIELDEGWREPLSQLSSRRRSDIRRAARRAAEFGEVTYQVESPAAGEAPALLDEFMTVEAASWKGRRGSALAADRVRAGFFRSYAAAAADAGILRMCFMRIDGQAVASQLAVATDGGFWLLKIGYDEEYARCSPGQLLALATIQHAAEQGLGSYEFLGWDRPWLRLFTDKVRPCTSLAFFPRTAGGAAARAAAVAVARPREAVRRLRGRGT